MEFIVKYLKGRINPFSYPNNGDRVYDAGYYIHIHWHHSRKFDLAWHYRWEGTQIHYGPYQSSTEVVKYLSSIYDRVKHRHDEVGCCIYLADEHRCIYYGYYFNYVEDVLRGENFGDGLEVSGYPYGWGSMRPSFGNQDTGWNNHMSKTDLVVQRHPSGGFAIYQ
jgi:hypothetical protein